MSWSPMIGALPNPLATDGLPSSEVELFPLTEYRARLEAKLAALPAEVTAPAVD